MAQGATSTCSHVAVAFQIKTGLQTRDFQFNFLHLSHSFPDLKTVYTLNMDEYVHAV